MSRFAIELENILLGKTDPLSVMFGDEVIYDVYRTGPTFSGASESIRKVLPYLVHKDCNATILEIGGGTGGTTGHALKVLNNRFKSYTFTDISASFFEKAKAKFSHSVHKMVFRPLDIEHEPSTQGFQENGYDIIIATDVLHATSDIVATLKNVHKLLKEGGILLMNEFINCPVWIQTVFGTLDGWWKFVDAERRTMGPTLSEEGWAKALKDAGFASHSVLPDYAAPLHGTFLAKKAITQAPPTQPWYIIPDESGIASEVAPLLSAEIVKSVTQIPDQSQVLYLPSLSPFIFNDISAPVLADLQQLASRSSRVIWVTSGAAMDVQSPTLAPIIGLARVLRNECPTLRAHTIDLDPKVSPAENAKLLHSLLSTNLNTFDAENELAIRNSKLYIPRLVPANVSTSDKTSVKLLSEATVKLEIGTPGLLNSLQWVECDQTGPSDDEVEIRVFATGVNFKDVMLSMGMLNKEAVADGFCSEKLGIECAGVVTKIGGKNSELNVGDRVVAVAKNSYSTYVKTPSCLAVKIPSDMSFEEAATIPATFLTAMYALYYLARLEKGETVLIHAAAGGVGQAAIQLCQLVGAKVFVTAGSDEKRKFLESEFGIPADQIMSSRTLDFAEQIKAKTGGKGVDVVLNSLAGDFLFKSMAIVAPFGRFLEIGKRDIYANSKLDMEPFGMNVSFFAIDLDRLNAAKPHIAGKMFRDLMKLFEDKKLKPMPFKVYPVTKVEDAFRYLQQGKNIGKVVLALDPAEKIQVVTCPKSLSLKPNGIYLLIGGMGGFGRGITTWMAEKGAKKLAFVSRSGASTAAAKQLLRELSVSFPDVEVVVEAADVTNFAQMQSATQKIRAAFNNMPILGVVQMAMVLQDIIFDKISADTFNEVVRPKAIGTQNLEKLVAADPLNFFVMFSSVSSVVGNFGQSSYASANAYLDALATQRQAKGLPGTSINWGAIGDVGYVAERKDLQEAMQRRGIFTLPLAEALSALEYSIVHQLAQVVVAPLQWSVASNSLPALSTRYFSLSAQAQENENAGSKSNAADASAQERVTARDRALAADAEHRATVVREIVREKLGAMLGVAGEDVEPSKKISDLGVDSLMAIEVKNWVDKEFSVQVSVLDLTGGKTIDDLAAKIVSSLASASPSSASAQSSGPYVCIKQVANPSQRVVCFPYLGGSASAFNNWKDLVEKDVEVWAWEPTAISEWDQLVNHLTTDISFFGDAKVPVAFYGHSLGALVAFEVACRLQSQGKPVTTVITGACGSPDQQAAFSKISEKWNDEALLALSPEVLTTGLLQVGIVESISLGADILRAELFLGRRYASWAGASKKFAGPITAIFGTKDSIVSNPAVVESWINYASVFRFEKIEGNHLFIHDHASSVVSVVARSLASKE